MYLSIEQLTSSPCPSFHLPDVQVVYEKGSGKINEDLFLNENGLYGVFDGATSLSSQTKYSGERTGGYIAAAIAAETFQENDQDLYSSVVLANDRIREAQTREHGPHGPENERYGLWSTSLAVVRITDDRLEYCSLGDASILLLTDDEEYTLLTPEMDIDRETLSMWKAYKGEKGSIYEVLSEQIRRVRNQMNIEYGVLNGETKALDFVESGSIPLTGITDVVLLTDGLLIPRENPEAPHDWDYFVELYKNGGLHKVREYVRNLQQQDPDNRRYPRFKTHDDIAAVSISCAGSL